MLALLFRHTPHLHLLDFSHIRPVAHKAFQGTLLEAGPATGHVQPHAVRLALAGPHHYGVGPAGGAAVLRQAGGDADVVRDDWRAQSSWSVGTRRDFKDSNTQQQSLFHDYYSRRRSRCDS